MEREVQEEKLRKGRRTRGGRKKERNKKRARIRTKKAKMGTTVEGRKDKNGYR
jgi:hypothetical protein